MRLRASSLFLWPIDHETQKKCTQRHEIERQRNEIHPPDLVHHSHEFHWDGVSDNVELLFLGGQGLWRRHTFLCRLEVVIQLHVLLSLLSVMSLVGNVEFASNSALDCMVMECSSIHIVELDDGCQRDVLHDDQQQA